MRAATWMRGAVFLHCGLLLVSLASTAGCSSTEKRLSLAPPSQRHSAEDYDEVRERWTRHERIILFRALDTTLEVFATCFSPDFNAAYAVKKAAMFRLPREEQTGLQAELHQQWEKHFSFFVAAATPEIKWNDFDRKGSVWRIWLLNDRGQHVSPVEITGLRDISATDSTLFPYVGKFHRAYIIRFPKVLPNGASLIGATSRQLVLRFAGPLGTTDLRWQLE